MIAQVPFEICRKLNFASWLRFDRFNCDAWKSGCTLDAYCPNPLYNVERPLVPCSQFSVDPFCHRLLPMRSQFNIHQFLTEKDTSMRCAFAYHPILCWALCRLYFSCRSTLSHSASSCDTSSTNVSPGKYWTRVAGILLYTTSEGTIPAAVWKAVLYQNSAQCIHSAQNQCCSDTKHRR